MTSFCAENIKSKPRRQRWERTEKQLGPCRVQHDLFLPASVELDVGIKEADDGRRGRVPAVYSGSDQALPLAVPHDLHQARVALVHVLVQVEFQLHWKRADEREYSFNWRPNDSERTLIMCFQDNLILMLSCFYLICQRVLMSCLYSLFRHQWISFKL